MESIVSLDKFYLFLGIFLAVCILVIVAIMLDLWDGVHTAKKTNQRVHSHKLRVTMGNNNFAIFAIRYYCMIYVLFQN